MSTERSITFSQGSLNSPNQPYLHSSFSNQNYSESPRKFSLQQHFDEPNHQQNRPLLQTEFMENSSNNQQNILLINDQRTLYHSGQALLGIPSGNSVRILRKFSSTEEQEDASSDYHSESHFNRITDEPSQADGSEDEDGNFLERSSSSDQGRNGSL